MFRRIFFAAIAAGVLAGALISVIHSFTTTPIILHAEEYESAGADAHAALSSSLAGVQLASRHAISARLLQFVHGDDGGESGAWAPADGLERTLYSTAANLILGVGFALLVVAGMALLSQPVTMSIGVLWGAAGFAVFTLAPALGLPPEVPGTMAADVGARQLWWVFAAFGAALGLGLLVFAGSYSLRVAGATVSAVPHIVGAPRPESIGGSVPPEIAGHFAATSIVVSAIFWVLIGSLSATFYRRLG